MSRVETSGEAVREGRTVEHSRVIMSQVFMPEHAGPGGVYVHGGEIMKLMDAAAGVAAVRHSHAPVMTLRVEGMNFFHPIRVGNYVTVHSRVTYTSGSSMEVQVKVVAEDILREKSWETCTAYFIYVALDEQGKPKKIPPLILSTEDDRRLFEAGAARHDTCRIDDQFKVLCAME